MNRNRPDQVQILVINSGSSSIKYQLLSLPEKRVFAHGLIEDIGGPHSRHVLYKTVTAPQTGRAGGDRRITDHYQAFKLIIETLSGAWHADSSPALAAIGHRVVHGGEKFIEPTRVDLSVLDALDRLSDLAPLQNPANVMGIKVCLDMFPDIPQVAVFDTAFHQTIPDYAYRYAIPEAWYRDFGIRRYGFHGSSHKYVAQQAAEFLQRPLSALNLITLHLGNGASVSAIQQGVCVDTSMGFTPLEGLVMGSRCGDLDASIPLFVQHAKQMTPEQVHDVLNHQSGLKGLAGTHDVRELLTLEKQGDEAARLALAAYVFRIRKYIGAYTAVLGRLDALVFTGGVGENSSEIRSRCCQRLDSLGMAIDEVLNSQAIDSIASVGPSEQPVKVLVIRTNEELQIAYEAWSLLAGKV